MSRHTVYLRPPNPPRPKKAKAKTGRQELKEFLFKYRAQLVPFLLAFFVAGFAAGAGPFKVGPVPVGTLVLAVTYAGMAWLMYQDQYIVPEPVPWPKLDRLVERRYAAGCAAVAGFWSTCATWHADKPSPRMLALGFLLTCAVSVPWWNHRRVRASIPVRMDGLSGTERRTELERVRTLVRDWTSFTSAGHAQGSRLRSVDITPWSTALHVRLRRGATVAEFTQRRIEKLESAFGGIAPGSARVKRDGGYAELATFLFMRRDPHAEPVRPPDDDHETAADKITIGLFETGETILFALVNTLIAGSSGSGKSGIVNMVIRALARLPYVAIVGIDMKPGATELGPWRGVMHALATNKAEAKDLIEKLRAGMEDRGERMSAKGQRKWKPTRQDPYIVLIVDEVQELRQAGLMRQLDSLTALFRAFGGFVVVATQHPIKPNLSPAIKMNCVQKMGTRTEDQSADRVIFGEGGTRNGWRPSTIPTDRPGSFFVRSPIYKLPVLGRAYWLEDGEIADEAAKWSGIRTMIDDRTWNSVRTERLPEIDAASPIIDAEIIRDDDPAELILESLERGRTSVTAVVADTGLSKATVYRYLGALREQGLTDSPARGKWVSLRVTALSQ